MPQVGIPADVIQALNCIACINLGPLIHRCLHPFLAKHKSPFGPHRPSHDRYHHHRFIHGLRSWHPENFLTAAVHAMNMPLACPSSHHGRTPNDVNVFLRVDNRYITS